MCNQELLVMSESDCFILNIYLLKYVETTEPENRDTENDIYAKQ